MAASRVRCTSERAKKPSSSALWPSCVMATPWLWITAALQPCSCAASTPSSSCANCLVVRMAYAEAWAGICTCSPRSTWRLLQGSSARAGPTAAGFALSAQYVRPGAIAVAFFGEGAMNQGMLMESLNLAAVWDLPVLFVCKDDGWAITTPSERVTGGDLNERARGLGVPAVDVDGCDVGEVWEAAHSAIARARSGGGPTFLHARCVHVEGHFLGLQTAEDRARTTQRNARSRSSARRAHSCG